MPSLDPHFHVGIVVADQRRAESHVSELLGVGRAGPDAPVTFGYRDRAELGLRVELIDAGSRDAFAPLFQPDTEA